MSLGIKRMAGLEINQVWADSNMSQKALRIVIDTTQGTGAGSGAAAFEIVVDNTVVWSIDKNGNRTVGGSSEAPVSVTAATVTLSSATHGGRTTVLNRASGIAVTLPAASGSGAKFNLVIGTTFTGAATIKVANSSDIMQGLFVSNSDGAASEAKIWKCGASDDTISFDGSTTGGYKGTFITLIDVATNLWAVQVVGPATGTEATPFSATV